MRVLVVGTQLGAPDTELGSGTTLRSIRMTPDVRQLAVFARNWPMYLDEATKLCRNSPNRRLAYQSRQRWVTAASAVGAAGPRKIYFAEIEGGPRVTHVAELVEVQVDASRQNPRTKRL